MTIGPAPMMRTEQISVRLGMDGPSAQFPSPACGRGGATSWASDTAPPSPRLFHHRDEAPEEIVAVPRPRARLGVVLHGKDLLARDAQPLVAAVEERDVGRHDAGGQALGHHHEAVILAGDLDAPGFEILDRVVGPAMAARHLRGLAAERQRQQLMAEADAEERRAGPDDVADDR